jgi:hypothetical protein
MPHIPLTAVAVVAGLITYNGHAGLGSNTASNVTDGTSNTIMSGERAALILMTDAGGQYYTRGRS